MTPARAPEVLDRCCSALARSCQRWQSCFTGGMDELARLRQLITRHAGDGVTRISAR